MILKGSTLYRHLTKYFIGSLFLIFCACGLQKKHTEALPVVEEPKPKIIFLTYTLSEAPSGERSMTFVSQKIVDGKLKRNSSNGIEKASEGDLICSQFDENSQLISRTLIKNPLKKTVESLIPTLGFESKALLLQQTKFSTRIALKRQTKIITISNFTNTKTLISTKIDLK